MMKRYSFSDGLNVLIYFSFLLKKEKKFNWVFSGDTWYIALMKSRLQHRTVQFHLLHSSSKHLSLYFKKQLQPSHECRTFNIRNHYYVDFGQPFVSIVYISSWFNKRKKPFSNTLVYVVLSRSTPTYICIYHCTISNCPQHKSFLM